MPTPQTEKLVRKQFLISPSQIKKLDRIARNEGTSVAEIVRVAIDNYNPDNAPFADLNAPELMNLVSIQLKEAIASTQKANRNIDRALKSLSKGVSNP
jgi:Ribbon-helix-helix protein, copG family